MKPKWQLDTTFSTMFYFGHIFLIEVVLLHDRFTDFFKIYYLPVFFVSSSARHLPLAGDVQT